MSRSVSLAWIGGEHEFALPLGGLRAVQKDCDAGPVQILNRLANGEWRVDDPVSVLRHGLTWGGMAQNEARELVLRMAELHGLVRLVVTARTVLAAAIIGEPEDDVGEPAGVNPSGQ